MKNLYNDADKYQQAALRTAGENEAEWLDNAILGLCGEVGECADIIKKSRHQGHPFEADHLIEELGDVCWYVALMASALHWRLSSVLEENIIKLQTRYPEGFDPERSLHREKEG